MLRHTSERNKRIATNLHPNRIDDLTIKELVLGLKYIRYGRMYIQHKAPKLLTSTIYMK